jgi:hypothetical protein
MAVTIKSDRISMPNTTSSSGDAGDLMWDNSAKRIKFHDGTKIQNVSALKLGENSSLPFTTLGEISGQEVNQDADYYYKPSSYHSAYLVRVNFDTSGTAKFKTTSSGAETTTTEGENGCSQGSFNFWTALRACLLRGKRLCNNGETAQNGTGCSHDLRYIWMNHRSGSNYQLYYYNTGSTVYSNPDNAYDNDTGIRCCSSSTGELWALS